MGSEIHAEDVDVRQALTELFEIELRVAGETPALVQIKDKEKFFEFLAGQPNSSTWIWKDESGKPVGYLTLVDKPEESELEVLAIRVDKGMRSSGYGKRMMEFAEKRAEELGRRAVMLATHPDNAKALGFYKRLGYSIVRRAENYYGDGTPRYILEKSLREPHPK